MENWLNWKSTYSVIPLFHYSLFRVLQIPNEKCLMLIRISNVTNWRLTIWLVEVTAQLVEVSRSGLRLRRQFWNVPQHF